MFFCFFLNQQANLVVSSNTLERCHSNENLSSIWSNRTGRKTQVFAVCMNGRVVIVGDNRSAQCLRALLVFQSMCCLLPRFSEVLCSLRSFAPSTFTAFSTCSRGQNHLSVLLSLDWHIELKNKGCSWFFRAFICQTRTRTCVISKRTHVHFFPSVCKN